MLWLAENYGFLLLNALLLAALIGCRSQQSWQLAERLLRAHLVLATALLGVAVFTSQSGSEGLFRFSGLSTTMSVLISFVALIVLRYARQNLSGDPDKQRFLRWYLATLLAVGMTVSTNHLIVFALAWMAISFSLHRLLLFYPDRPRAALAAHKKFLLARFSELLLFSVFAILYSQHGTANIDVLLSHYAMGIELGTVEILAAILLAAVALIKCAQLPVHGWLVQVVEAPTPVSALLHAGVINMGGFLLLLFSPLLNAASPAQWLLLIVASSSCCLASLVMMTRISIKVRLAWSTIAQMGLMLMQCALGLYHLAMLHLIAHSCYKAYAFLDSGNAVNRHLRTRFSGSRFPDRMHWVSAFGCVGALFSVAILIAGAPAMYSPWVLMSVALSSLLAFHFSCNNKLATIRGLIIAVAGTVFYIVMSLLSENLSGSQPVYASPAADAYASLLFLSLFVTYGALQRAGRSALLRASFITLNAGLYLDEWATRLTLRIWPAKLPSQPAHQGLQTDSLSIAAVKE